MNPAEAAELWDAVMNMVGCNPVDMLPRRQWDELYAHMIKWGADPMWHPHTVISHKRALQIAWASLYLYGRIL